MRFLAFALAALLVVPAAELAAQTLPRKQRPEWLRQEGLIMAGSWEPLTYRTRQGATGGHVPTAEERAVWEHEHSPEVTAQLKALGVNFIMMHCYKGAGLEVEKQTMQDAARFARHYREAGLHVGVYAYSGAFLWEPLYREIPEAQNWVLLDKNFKPFDYYHSGIRYYWNRSHPGAQAFYKKIVDFAVDEIKADLLHFDNHSQAAGNDAYSTAQFREFLRRNFSAEQLAQMGAADLSRVMPLIGEPVPGPSGSPRIMEGKPQTLLDYAWLRFASEQLADAYMTMSRHAHSKRSDILVELNAGGPGNMVQSPRDYGRLLQGGDALWSEGNPSGFANGRYDTRIRSYKIARSLDNLVFFYAATPLSMAESMAFNSDCLGCIAHFADGKVVSPRPPEAPVSDAVRPYIEFYRTRRELLRDAEVVADLAVLRSFPSQVFGDERQGQLTSRVEQTCVDQRIPFQIVHEHQLADLGRFRALVLAGCVALSDVEIDHIRRYVTQGGRLCIIGPVATHNEWMIPRKSSPLDQVAAEHALRIAPGGNLADALRQAAGGRFSVSVTAPEGLFAEFTTTPTARLVHLVNYRPERPVKDVLVRLQVPAGKTVKRVQLASPEHKTDIPLEFRREGAEVTFTVPVVGTYEIASVIL